MDPISDMFIRIKNAQAAGHETVALPYSKFKHEIAKVLEKHEMVKSIERKGKRVRKTLEIELKPLESSVRIHDVKLISKPSRRLYTPFKKIPQPKHGGLVLLSTPKGVMCEREARKIKVGGEILAEVW